MIVGLTAIGVLLRVTAEERALAGSGRRAEA
jgi:hypothetical protein